MFDTGFLVLTPEIQKHLNGHYCDLPVLFTALDLHKNGDYGDIPTSDKELNDVAVKDGYNVLSAYRFSSGIMFLIMTEGSREKTLVLFPSEAELLGGQDNGSD